MFFFFVSADGIELNNMMKKVSFWRFFNACVVAWIMVAALLLILDCTLKPFSGGL